MEKYNGIEKYQGTRKYSKLIERRFYQHDKIRQAVFEARNDSGAGKTGGNGSGHAFVSDPTANVAIRKVSPLHAVTIEIGKNEVETIKWPEKWLAVIEATYRRYEGGSVESLLKRRYDGETHAQTCMELCISQNVYYCILREVSQFALACACQVGLVKIF
jgi:hypothetical protein